jgi:diguanylate cyclase (GGDEF)-like protein/PAS domain S-box-containing protein
MPADSASSPGFQGIIAPLERARASGRKRLPLRVLPEALLIGGLVVTAVAAEQMRSLNRARHLQIRQGLVGDVAEAIKAKLQIDQAVLSSVVGLFRSSDAVSREEFAEFYRSVASENPSLEGITGVGFSRLLTPAELPAFEQRLRAEGWPEFRVTPPGRRSRYSSIEYLEPNSWRNRRAFGFDMYSEPVRREAMERAAANNEPALSGPVTLLQETKEDTQTGVLLYLPIYRTGPSAQTSDERWRQLVGWAYSPIRTRDLIQAALRPLTNPALPGSRIVVLDASAGQTPTPLFDSAAGRQSDTDLAVPSGPNTTEREIPWGGRSWRIVLELAPHLGHAHGLDASVWLTLTSGVALSSVLSLLSRQFVDNLQATRRALAESEKAAEERALSSTVFEASSLAIVVTNLEGYILTANNAFTQLTGYRVNEIVGQRSNLLKSGRHELGFYKTMWDGLESRGFWEGDLWNRVRSGEIRRHHLAITSVRDAQLRTRFYVGMLQDITDRHAAEEAIRYQALHDTLTGLANRSLLMEQLEREVALGQRQGSPLALLYIDLDGFKPVNDQLGHAAGDTLLLQVAERLRSCTRESDMVCRQGGDEFVILVPQAGPPQELDALARKLQHKLREPFVLKESTVQVSASIGIARFPDHGRSADALLRAADQAMYRAKAAGGGQFSRCEPEGGT